MAILAAQPPSLSHTLDPHHNTSHPRHITITISTTIINISDNTQVHGSSAYGKDLNLITLRGTYGAAAVR